jgi:hypothetical protein
MFYLPRNLSIFIWIHTPNFIVFNKKANTFFSNREMRVSLTKNAEALSPTIFFSLKQHFSALAVSALLGALIAAGIALTLPKQWPATLLFKIGQVESAANLLAKPNDVVQRINFPNFPVKVVQSQRLRIAEFPNERRNIVKKTLSADMTRDGDLVKMTVNGHTPSEAKENLSRAFEVLQTEHEELLRPSLTKLREDIVAAKNALEKKEDERAILLELRQRMDTSEVSEKNISEEIILTSMLRSNTTELQIFREKISALDEKLNPHRTFNTRAVTAIHVPAHPAFPKIGAAALLGFSLGLLAAGIGILMRDKESRSAICRNGKQAPAG